MTTVDVRCEACGRLLMVADEGTSVSGSLEILCKSCKQRNTIKGNIYPKSRDSRRGVYGLDNWR